MRNMAVAALATVVLAMIVADHAVLSYPDPRYL